MDGLHSEPLRGYERCFDPRSHFLWDHLSWQLHYRTFHLAACHSMPHYSVSHDPLSYHSELRSTAVTRRNRDFSDKALLSRSSG